VSLNINRFLYRLNLHWLIIFKYFLINNRKWVMCVIVSAAIDKSARVKMVASSTMLPVPEWCLCSSASPFLRTKSGQLVTINPWLMCALNALSLINKMLLMGSILNKSEIITGFRLKQKNGWNALGKKIFIMERLQTWRRKNKKIRNTGSQFLTISQKYHRLRKYWTIASKCKKT